MPNVKTLRLAAWSQIFTLIVSQIAGLLFVLGLFAHSAALVWALFSVAAISLSAAIYALVVLKKLFHHLLQASTCDRHFDFLIAAFTAGYLLLPMAIMPGAIGNISLVALVVATMITGLPILLLGLAIQKHKPDLFGLRTAFGILGIVTGISFLTLVGIFIVGSYTLLAWGVLLVVILFRAARSADATTAPIAS